MNEQRKGKSGQVAKKSEGNRCTSCFCCQPLRTETVSDVTDTARTVEGGENDVNENNTNEEDSCNIERVRTNTNRQKKKIASFEESLLHILKEKKDEVIEKTGHSSRLWYLLSKS